MTKPNLLKKFVAKKCRKWVKNRVFGIYIKIWSLNFSGFVFNRNSYYLLCLSTNPIFGENFVLEIWVKMLLASKIAGFLNQLSIAWWCKFMETKSWLKISWMCMFNDGCGYSGLWTLKSAVYQEWIYGINRFFACRRA